MQCKQELRPSAKKTKHVYMTVCLWLHAGNTKIRTRMNGHGCSSENSRGLTCSVVPVLQVEGWSGGWTVRRQYPCDS